MVRRNEVKRLKQCVIEAIAKDTVSRFNFLFSSIPTNVGVEPTGSTVVVTRQQVIDAIGDRLNEFLVGSYSDVKSWIVEHFVNTYRYSQNGGNEDLCFAFFRCLLDESFTNFSMLGIPGFTIADPTELLQIICQQSPLVQALYLCFGRLRSPVAFNPQFSQMLSTLNRLTSLKLSWNMPDCLPFYRALGNACPQLTVLELSNFSFGTLEFLALFLGPQLDLVLQSLLIDLGDPSLHCISCNNLSRFEISPGCLTPICSSLRELIHRHNPQAVGTCLLHRSTIIFILRHLRQLKNIQHRCINNSSINLLGNAIQFLHEEQIQSEDDDPVATFHPFQSADRQSSGVIEWTFDPRFTGI